MALACGAMATTTRICLLVLHVPPPLAGQITKVARCFRIPSLLTSCGVQLPPSPLREVPCMLISLAGKAADKFCDGDATGVQWGENCHVHLPNCPHSEPEGLHVWRNFKKRTINPSKVPHCGNSEECSPAS